MKLIISDLKIPIHSNKDIFVIQNDGNMKPCMGCFNCWVGKEKQCIIKDGYEDIGDKMSQCDEIIVLSEGIYGEFSPFIKRVFDRSIGYVKPFFSIKKGKMHHKRRFQNIMSVSAFIYGENLTFDEKETMKEMLSANADNYESTINLISFYQTSERALEAVNEYSNHKRES